MNKNELRAEMVRNNKTHIEVAEAIGITGQGLYNKLDSRNEFKLSEIKVIIDILNLDDKKRNDIFFS